MSVATELTRIQGAKADLKTSIESKGVTVPSSALIDEYADYVDAIHTGGGGDTAMKENVQGTLTSYTIPNDVTSIRNYAFYACKSLTSVTISNSVTTIGDGAFSYCFELASVTIGNGVTSIGNSAFNGCSSLTSFTIPNGVTTIGNNAFQYCSGLTSVTIGNGVTTIGDKAFNDCSKLESVTIPDSVTFIGDNAFQSCTNLQSVTIPNGVTTIGRYTFNNCVLLQTITIPSNVTSISYSALFSCQSLKYIKFSGLTPPSISSYSSQLEYMQDILVPESAVSDYVAAFPSWENRIFADTHTHDYSVTELRYSNQTDSTPFTQLSDTTLNTSNVSKTNLKRVYIGNNVTTVEESTFANTSSIPILIPEVNSLETIGANAFNGGVIGDLHLPNVTSIGNVAFQKNQYMLSVTIGDRITSIGATAFDYCKNLKSVTCLATTPPTLGSYAFYDNASGRKIYVPAASVEAYKTAWSEYAADIEAIPSV